MQQIWEGERIAVVENTNHFFLFDTEEEEVKECITYQENIRKVETGERNKTKGWAVAMAKGIEVGMGLRETPYQTSDKVNKDLLDKLKGNEA